MSESPTPSPLPWKRGTGAHAACIESGDMDKHGHVFCEGHDYDMYGSIAPEDIDLIVRSVNAHAALVEALKLVDSHFTRNNLSGNFQCDDEHEAWTKVRDALALAEPQK